MQSASFADIFLDKRRRDQAYVEYLVASEIAVNIIPGHRQWLDLQSKPQLYNQYKNIMNKIRANMQQYENIKNIIINEDKRSSVQSQLSATSAPEPQRPLTANGYRPFEHIEQQPRSATPTAYWNPVRHGETYSSSSSRATSAATYSSGRSTPVNNPVAPRPKPPVRPPKPEALQGHAITHEQAAISNPAAQELTERFARLRGSGLPTGGQTGLARSDSASSSASAVNGQLLRMPSPADFAPDPSKSSAVPSSLRPGGPRDMPPSKTDPRASQKLPLDTQMVAAMPKPPSPTYSPARNMQTPGGINPPRSTARSAVPTSARKGSVASSISSRAPGSEPDSNSYFPKANGDADDNTGSRRRGSVGLPREGRSITAQMLFDYLKLYHILLIDVRDRKEFDNGHIDHTAILCVEPLTLRKNMSADELQNALVLSPDIEQGIFDRRDRFELVVYYDQSTPTSAFLSRSNLSMKEEALKILYDSLVEFNFERPLRRQPILLEGGLDAWEDLLGLPALRTSDTAATIAAKATRPNRKSVPIPSHLPELAVDKKRRREFNPLDAEEARKWEERARAESLPIELPTSDEGEGEEEEPETPFYRTKEDFFRRYPEVPIEQESMVQAPQVSDHPTPPMPRPQQPPPSYPAPSIPSDPPSVPSRPPPAAPRVSYSGAHERAVAPYNAMSRVSQLPPYIPPKDMPHNIRLPKTGLINFGVTCYMNSTIQCLNATIPLTMRFRDGTYKSYIQHDNWKGSKGILPEYYANLVSHLWKGDVMACRPTTFRSFCARLRSEWGRDQQQDAKEFYDFVIDFLHEDLNINWRAPPPHVLSPSEEAIREKMYPAYAAKIEWTRWSKRDKSIISDLFAGQHASRLKCKVCGHTSTTYETFYSISVEIPRSAAPQRGGKWDLYDCLRSYCKEEELSKNERWKCPSCKKERDATKRISLTRVPRHLVVHFKRFSASHTHSAQKVRTTIDFPLTNLDIEPYVLAPPTAADTERTIKASGDENLRNFVTDESMQPPYRYDAYAVIRHIGTSVERGHYIACVRDPGRACWREFDDSKVSDFDPRDGRVTSEQAYIVFFERQFVV